MSPICMFNMGRSFQTGQTCVSHTHRLLVCYPHTHRLLVCYPHTSSCPDNTLIHMAQLFQKPKQLTQLPLVVYEGLLQNSLAGDQQSKLCILFMLLSLVCLLLCFLNEAQNQIKGSHNCHRETQLAHLLTNLFLHHTHCAHTLTAMYMQVFGVHKYSLPTLQVTSTLVQRYTRIFFTNWILLRAVLKQEKSPSVTCHQMNIWWHGFNLTSFNAQGQ